MDSTMTINIRVIGRNAIAQLNAVGAAAGGVASAGSSSAARQTTQWLSGLNGTLVKTGKNLQWVGRQLTFNFTLPLVAAGILLTKTNLGIEKSMTNVIKVYGDLLMPIEQVNAETNALRTSFELLSTRFGVHQEEVIDVAAAWAQAGSAGRGLAENVKATLEVMILGEMDAAAATEGLIAIQATWRLSTIAVGGQVSELHAALAQLNIIENQTGISMSGLVEVMQRAGGAARTAGMSIRELGAFAAALVPATGSAAQAGNALKTIISRLQAPTKETIDILAKMGITVADPAWLGKTATEKIITMSTAFNGLSTANKNLVSSIIASRWQVNRFSVLMADVGSETGYFNQAMMATADQARANAKYQQELMTVLQSSPRKWDIMTNAIRNSMAAAFIPLIPVVMNILGVVAKLATAFANLPENTRRWITIGLMALALVGPIAQLSGAFMVLGGIALKAAKVVAVSLELVALSVFKFVEVVSQVLIELGTAFVGLELPLWAVVAIIAAVVAAIIIILDDDLRKNAWNIIKSVAQAFWALPQAIAAAFNAVIRVISRAIEIIVEQLSYLNPFARHSPSLVDNVKAGVATILSEYAKFAQIPGLIKSSVKALDDFSVAAAPGARNAKQADLMQSQQTISKTNPSAGPAAATLVEEIMKLYDELPPLAKEIEHQTLVVTLLTAAYDEAQAAVDAAQAALDDLQTQFETVAGAIDDANAQIDHLVNTPLIGMHDLEEQLFANTMAQNELNMALLQYEQQGYTLDSIRDKYAEINGQVEMLRGEENDLRLAGAGSDVLGVYEDQISAIEEQRQNFSGIEQDIIDINKQLDNLNLEQRFLELTKAITFDPLLHQIENVANVVEEMSFDDVVAGIQEQQALIADLQPQYDQLVESIKDQEQAVKDATAARDAVKDQLDAEQDRLDKLTEAYDAIVSLIKEMEQALNDAAQAAESLAGAKGGGGAGDLFDAGAGVDYPIQGGDTPLGPEGGLADIEAFNKEMEAELQRVLESMGQFDVLGVLKEKWGKAVEYLKELWSNVSGWLSDTWKNISDNFHASFGGDILDWLKNVFWAGIVHVFDSVKKKIMEAWQWVNLNVVPVIRATVSVILAIWNTLWPLTSAAFNVMVSFIKANLQGLVEGFLLFAGILSEIWTVLWTFISGTVTAVWNFIVGLLEGIFDVIRGIFEVFTGLLTGDWERAWEGIKEIFHGAWEMMSAFLQLSLDLMVTAIKTVIEIIQGIITIGLGIIMFIWDTTWRVLSGIVYLVWETIKGIIGTAINLIASTISMVVDGVLTAWNTSWEDIKGVVSRIWNGIQDIVRNAILFLRDNIIKPVTDKITSAWNTVWDGVKNTVYNVWEDIKGIVGRAVDAIMVIVNGAISGIEHLIDMVKDPTNLGGGHDTPGVPWARGGIVRHATWGVVGEAGPEVVIPLTDARRAMQLVSASGLLGLIGMSHASSPGSTFGSLGAASTTSTTVIQINGNLEFPNITDGSDAETFIDNLKILAAR